MIFLVIGSMSELSGNLPEYNQRYLGLRDQLFGVLQGYGVDTSKLLQRRIARARRLVKPAAGIVGVGPRRPGHSFFILLITTFLLIEFMSLFRGTGRRPAQRASAPHSCASARLAGDIQKYVGINAIMGLIGAVVYFVLLKVIGVPYIATWVVLFFVLSFVPTIGGPLAVAPVLLLVLLEQGVERTLLFAVLFICLQQPPG